jgi:hypothetical protein
MPKYGVYCISNDEWMSMERWWHIHVLTGGTTAQGETHVSLSICGPKIPHTLPWDWTQVCKLRRPRLATCDVTKPRRYIWSPLSFRRMRAAILEVDSSHYQYQVQKYLSVLYGSIWCQLAVRILNIILPSIKAVQSDISVLRCVQTRNWEKLGTSLVIIVTKMLCEPSNTPLYCIVLFYIWRHKPCFSSKGHHHVLITKKYRM